MLARISTFALDGLESRRVWIECDIRSGLPTFTVVGLADRAVREARERVRSAILNSGFEFPAKRITVNLAPAYLRKAGPGFDLGLAMAVLAASGQVPEDRVIAEGYAGELSLAGELRPVRGALAIAEGARCAGLASVTVPVRNGPEAALVGDLPVHVAATLRDVVDVVCGRREPEVAAPAPVPPKPVSGALPDLSDVRGHAFAIGALGIAAAGGHNLLMTGPPGTGKTMLARRLPSVLPPLSGDEALDVVRVHSAAGLGFVEALPRERPFRAPHHTISAAGLVGGGAPPRPGEVSLAHHGVLFLDELSEFPGMSLEALRQPLEDGTVAIVRGQRTRIFPSRCMLVAASNPCPCGNHGGGAECRCGPATRERHERRLSGPLADRIDVRVTVARPAAEDLEAPPVTTSAALAQQVLAARERQARRYAGTGLTVNAQLPAGLVDRLAGATPEVRRQLVDHYRAGSLSARGHIRVLRVARTVADLAGSDRIEVEHLSEALAVRDARRTEEVAA